MSGIRPIPVSRPGVPTPAPEEPRSKQPRYRQGKTMLSVDLSADQHDRLTLLTFDLRRLRPRRSDGRPLAQVDLVKEALDDFFEKHHGERPFGTPRSD